jgi:uncharacterized membrane protein
MTSHAAVEQYLGRLQRSMRDLPVTRRDEIVEEIREHIEGMLAEAGPEVSDVDVRNILERVGNPDEIAAEARERFGIKSAKPSWTDTAAVILLPIGGLVLPVIGWIVAVVLLWISDVWSTRDKVIGTLVVPGGLVLPFGLAVMAVGPNESCDGSPGGAIVRCVHGPSGLAILAAYFLISFLVLGPIVVAVYLGRKLHRARLAPE